MRDVSDQTRQLILDPSTGGGGFDVVWVADLMYDGERRLQDVPITRPGLAWNKSSFVAGSGSVSVVWADDFGSSMIPRHIGDWFSPFGAELQVDCLIGAGRFRERVPMGRFLIDSVPDADSRRILFQGSPISPGETFGLDLVDRLAKVNRDKFRFPTRALSTSAWDEIQSITGFPVVRNLPDAAVPPSLAYEGDKTTAVNQLFDLLGAWPKMNADGTLTALPKAWGDPVAEVRGRVSAPVRMSNAETFNVVVVEGKSPDGVPIYAVAEIVDGFLRVRNASGSASPFGSRVMPYSSPLLITFEQCAAYARDLLGRVSRLTGVTRSIVEPFNPLREIGDVLAFEGGLVRVSEIRHAGAETRLEVEVPDE